MNLLALDTSSEGCSAALIDDHGISDRFEAAPRGHTRLLMPMIRALLEERQVALSDIDAIAFACGPGSFTGLRIASGVVQGLAYGLDVPVVPVSSLAAVAARAIQAYNPPAETGVAVGFDARMGEVYWGCFRNRDGLPEPLGPERVCAPEQLSLPEADGDWIGAGSGWGLQDRMPADLVDRIPAADMTLVPRAREVAFLALHEWNHGHRVTAADARPVYLRDEVTWKKLPGR